MTLGALTSLNETNIIFREDYTICLGETSGNQREVCTDKIQREERWEIQDALELLH
jgi:diphthamide biosynthesis methyltransferase